MPMDVSILGDTAGYYPSIEMDDGNGEDDDGDEEDDNDDDEDMELFDFRDRVMGVLKGGAFEEKRSSKLAQADFVHLLSLFNKAGIHFS